MDNSKKIYGQENERPLVYKLILSALTSLFLIIAWHIPAWSFIIFFAFVPFFFTLDKPPVRENEKSILYIAGFLLVFFWIYVSMYWIKPVNSPVHYVLSLLASCFLYLPIALAYFLRFKRNKTTNTSIISFVLLWTSIEVLHDFVISGFPYLNLGQLAGNYPWMIQWYKITGSIGGTLWIFLVNILIFLVIKRLFYVRNSRHIFSLFSVILVPLVISVFMYRQGNDTPEPGMKIIAVHTDANVFDYKYNVDADILLEEYLAQSSPYLEDSMVNIVLWPENALTGKIFYHQPDSSYTVNRIKDEICHSSDNILVSGSLVDEISLVEESSDYPPNIMFDSKEGLYYKKYNAVLFVRDGKKTQIKTKQKLVPLSERIPVRKFFSPFLKMVPNLADLNFSFRKEGNPVFKDETSGLRIDALICWESAFSSFVAGEVKTARANLLTLHMNESWMRSYTSNYHFNLFAISRAVENQRFIAKSSNDGMSSIIDRKGRVLALEQGYRKAVIESPVYLNDRIGFYTRYHGIILWIFLLAGILNSLYQLYSSRWYREK